MVMPDGAIITWQDFGAFRCYGVALLNAPKYVVGIEKKTFILG